MRCVHDPARRQAGQLLPDSCGDARRRRDRHHRGTWPTTACCTRCNRRSSMRTRSSAAIAPSGQIMSGVGCIAEGHTGSPAEIREWMSGNICRCGAYTNIVGAIADTAPGRLARVPVHRSPKPPTSSPRWPRPAAGARYIAGRHHAGGSDAGDGRAPRRRRRHQRAAVPGHRPAAARLRVGSLVRMSELAAHPACAAQFPVIAQALELSASAQTAQHGLDRRQPDAAAAVPVLP